MQNFTELVKAQREFFLSGEARTEEFRLRQLNKLYSAVKYHDADIARALQMDLSKSSAETYMCETGIVREEIRYMLDHLRAFVMPKRVSSSLANFPSKSMIYPEPYGVTLIMSPWNYPFQLAMVPLASAIAAGNCAIVKPSAYAPETSKLIAQICKECFDENYVAVVEGGRDVNAGLLDEKFDLIFFTGSPNVGKIVMEKAAKYLTPVILELGGKSPCIVDDGAQIELAAKRIVWGKSLNCGQTCITPDYILAHKNIKSELEAAILRQIKLQLGENQKDASTWPKVVTPRHYERLMSLIEDGKKAGEKLLLGGEGRAETQKIDFTVFTDVTWDSPLMQEEIFGPILPILEYEDLTAVCDAINRRARPLALYVFTESTETEETVLGTVVFGGGCVNDTISHIADISLPFGGVGESGMGCYHGRAGFDAFTHYKSVLKRSTLIDLPLRYRQDTQEKQDKVDALIRKVIH